MGRWQGNYAWILFKGAKIILPFAKLLFIYFGGRELAVANFLPRCLKQLPAQVKAKNPVQVSHTGGRVCFRRKLEPGARARDGGQTPPAVGYRYPI